MKIWMSQPGEVNRSRKTKKEIRRDRSTDLDVPAVAQEIEIVLKEASQSGEIVSWAN